MWLSKDNNKAAGDLLTSLTYGFVERALDRLFQKVMPEYGPANFTCLLVAASSASTPLTKQLVSELVVTVAALAGQTPSSDESELSDEEDYTWSQTRIVEK